jgi:hypothetical protein
VISLTLQFAGIIYVPLIALQFLPKERIFLTDNMEETAKAMDAKAQHVENASAGASVSDNVAQQAHVSSRLSP